MKVLFGENINEVLLLHEKRRTFILIILFAVGIGYRFLDLFVLKTTESGTPNVDLNLTWLFPVTILLFEVVSFIVISKHLRSNRKHIPLGARYVNTVIEVCLPSCMIFIIAKQYPQFNVLNSPVVYIYFVFIILSTLRLNFWLSFFCGVFSAASYFTFSYFLYEHFYASDGVKVAILVFSGIAAGLVAQQIRSGINKLLVEVEKRHLAEHLFGQQISMEIAEKMLENNGAIESKRMQVAVMFVDIRNFTQYASDRSPEEIVQYQNDFFKIVIDTVTKNNGIINQFLGDGCMVTFGAPVKLGNPSQHAVAAAVMLLHELNRLLPATRVGIGIHAGEAVTGNIGTAQRRQYSITGSVVILASRIEQLNKQFGSQLLVSEEVIQSIEGDQTAVDSFGYVALKGWHKPVGVYKLA
ncbi:adenylate/guanylate cyclase domain-containing protein [Niastella sp. OAS944]|uniref:adenylate/guanylate cyclase domain-containing protein n=1 Tax=Niastella sp. OAS944 TaxID=2664089 RepID=UPI00347E832F|nr:adenylate cyclase [Chitinophagaceae bacterium OAS944]